METNNMEKIKAKLAEVEEQANKAFEDYCQANAEQIEVETQNAIANMRTNILEQIRVQMFAPFQMTLDNLKSLLPEEGECPQPEAAAENLESDMGLGESTISPETGNTESDNGTDSGVTPAPTDEETTEKAQPEFLS